MTDSVANIPVKIVPEVDLSSFDRGLLKAQKSLGSILADIPERTNPRGRFRGSSSGDYIKASTYRDTLKNWVKAYETAPKNKKYNLVNSALEDLRENAPATSPFNIIKTFKGMFKDVGVDMPRSVMDNADVWKKQTQKNDKERIAREKKDSKNTEKQTKDLDSISSFIQKGALGFGMRLAPYAIAAKAASSAVRGLQNIHSQRAMWGDDYSRSMERAAYIYGGDKGSQMIQDIYNEYGNFKENMEMGFVNTGMIERVGLATRGNRDVMNALMKGDVKGFTNAVFRQGLGMERNKARAMFSQLFPNAEAAMLLYDESKKQGINALEDTEKFLEKAGTETAWRKTSDAEYETEKVARYVKEIMTAYTGNIGNMDVKATIVKLAGNIVESSNPVIKLAKNAVEQIASKTGMEEEVKQKIAGMSKEQREQILEKLTSTINISGGVTVYANNPEQFSKELENPALIKGSKN